MLGLFRKKHVPPLHRDNPGDGARIEHVVEATGARLDFDLAAMLQETLNARNIRCKRRKNALELQNGLILQPRFLQYEFHPNGFRTATTIQANHDVLFADGLFEFQHSYAATFEESLRNGFEQWAQMDLVTLCDAMLDTPTTSMTMRFELPDERVRRAVFGPYIHYMQTPPEAGTAAEEEAGRFCPCCLFTNAADALKPLLHAAGTIGLRLYAARMIDGENAADCRANGLDHAEGSAALRAYAESWPALEGFQFRKQYVILHDIFPPTLRSS